MKEALQSLLASARDFYNREPARANALVTSAIVAVAATLGIVLSPVSTALIVGIGVPVILNALLRAERVRGKVVPVVKLPDVTLQQKLPE